MEKKELRQRLAKKMTKGRIDFLRDLLQRQEFYIPDVLELVLDEEPQIAFRAAWLLEAISIDSPMLFGKHVKKFLIQIPKLKHPSLQRHYSKILMQMTMSSTVSYLAGVYEEITAPENKEELAEQMFDWLINPKTPVAVQVNCLDVLANLTPSLPWIKEELLAQIEFFLRDGSPAMQSRGKKVKAKLLRIPEKR